MRVACVQFAPYLGNIEVNTARIVDDIARIDADVLVFPELATTGYFHIGHEEVRRVAEPVTGASTQQIINAAHQYQKVVICGFAELDGQQVFNSALIAGKGVTEPRVYRKSHLFYKETLGFTPGDSGFFVTYLEHLDCHLGVMICYDWRFPESARSLALQGADLIACPSNLITHIWRMAMPVRALENKVYLAVANRIGTETNAGEEVSFNGQTAIYDTNGAVLGDASAAEDCVVIIDIDPAATRTKSFNSINDIIRDRRPDLYVK